MPQTYDAAVSHERTPAAEHRAGPARAYFVMNDAGRIVPTDDPSEGASVGLLVLGTPFGNRLVPESPTSSDDVPARRYGVRVTV
jgi:hypothetical protein